MCFGECRIYEEFGSLWDQQPWSYHGVVVREGLCYLTLSCFSFCELGFEAGFCFRLCLLAAPLLAAQ